MNNNMSQHLRTMATYLEVKLESRYPSHCPYVTVSEIIEPLSSRCSIKERKYQQELKAKGYVKLITFILVSIIGYLGLTTSQPDVRGGVHGEQR